MLSTLTVAWALTVAAADPQPAPQSISSPPASYSRSYSSDGFDDDYGGDDCGCDSCRGGRGGCGDPLAHLFWRSHSPCNMAPPEPPCSDSHGYYYFRPYNYGLIAAHQEFAAEWGIDTRNPYSNEIFQGIYERAEAGPVEVQPGRVIEEAPGPANPPPREKGVKRGRDSASKTPPARTAGKVRIHNSGPQRPAPARAASVSLYSGANAVADDREAPQPRLQSRVTNR